MNFVPEQNAESDSPLLETLSPASTEELVEMLHAAGAEQRRLTTSSTPAKSSGSAAAPAGTNGTDGDSAIRPLCLKRMNRVIDYPARDMTITVEAGMSVGELDRILQAENQQLPIDWCDPEQTLGALVAADVSGSRRFGYGTLRDYLIGIEAVDGSGRVFHAGGRVVKNVAGYDLCRLLIGSQGALAILTRLTLKLKPRPSEERLLIAGFRNLSQLESTLEKLNRSAARPMMMDVINRSAAMRLLPDVTVLMEQNSEQDEAIRFADCSSFVVVGIEGSAASCDWQLSALRDELQDRPHWISTDSKILAPGLPEMTAALSSGRYRRTFMTFRIDIPETGMLARLSTLPSRIVSTMTMLSQLNYDIFGHAGNGVLYLRSSDGQNEDSENREQREAGSKRHADCLRLLKEVISDGVGSLKLVHPRSQSVSHASAETLKLMTKLKQVFDPRQILDPFDQ